MRLLLPFVILPIIEIALFVVIGGKIGVFATLALVVLSALIGIAAMRNQGSVAVQDMQRAVQEFRDPARPMAQGALTMIGGTLMVLPGFLTSAIGLILLLPPVQKLIARKMSARVRVVGGRSMSEADYGDEIHPAFRRGGPPRGEGTIDGEYSVQDDPPAPVREGLADERRIGTGRGSDRRSDGPGKSGWTRH